MACKPSVDLHAGFNYMCAEQHSAASEFKIAIKIAVWLI